MRVFLAAVVGLLCLFFGVALLAGSRAPPPAPAPTPREAISEALREAMRPCEEDWRRCGSWAHLVVASRAAAQAIHECGKEAAMRVSPALLEWPDKAFTALGHVDPLDHDVVTTGVLKLYEPRARLVSAARASAPVRFLCFYDLKKRELIDMVVSGQLGERRVRR